MLSQFDISPVTQFREEQFDDSGEEHERGPPGEAAAAEQQGIVHAVTLLYPEQFHPFP